MSEEKSRDDQLGYVIVGILALMFLVGAAKYGVLEFIWTVFKLWFFGFF